MAEGSGSNCYSLRQGDREHTLSCLEGRCSEEEVHLLNSWALAQGQAVTRADGTDRGGRSVGEAREQ